MGGIPVQVTDDPELLNWWDEVQHKAHPDIKTGWPALRTIADLRDILTTIAWTATAHHAAVGNGAPPLWLSASLNPESKATTRTRHPDHRRWHCTPCRNVLALPPCKPCISQGDTAGQG